MAMTRTPEWIIERATAAIAQRIEFTAEVLENKDILIKHAPTQQELLLISYAWANKDNEDDSVYKWVNARVHDFLTAIEKQLTAERKLNKGLSESSEPVLPPAVPRKRGRPKGSTKKKKKRAAEPVSEVVAT